MRPPRALLLVAILAAAALACRGGDRAPEPAAAPAGEAAAFDWERPASALELDAAQAAARLGTFAWSGTVAWNVHRGEGSRASSASERHALRQTSAGDFAVEATIDPGRGPGSETGREVVHVGGRTYGRSRWAPFRERPADRGREAARARDESFRIAGDVARLLGPALTLEERGATAVLGRNARRFTFGLDRARKPGAEKPPAPQGRSEDDDTRRRVELLEGAVPLAASGELVLDAETGVPLRVELKATLGVPSDPQLRAEVQLAARVEALGAAVVAVRAPAKALPDERKPQGVAGALEAAGLKQATGRRGSGESAEPADPAPAPAD